MYEEEIYSFLNKTFTKCAIGFYVFLCIVGYFISDFKTTISILGVITFIYFLILLKTIKIKKKYKYFKENGTKCEGFIKDTKIETYYDSAETYFSIKLIVEYKNPYSNKIEQTITDTVNGDPFTYLSSLDVTVYVLDNGEVLVTDFKRIKKLDESYSYKNNKEFKNEIYFERKNRFKLILFDILFLILIFNKNHYFISFIIILLIILILIIINNKKI